MTNAIERLKVKLFKKPVTLIDYTEMFYRDYDDNDLEKMINDLRKNPRISYPESYSIIDADAHKDCGLTSIFFSSHYEYFDYYYNAIKNNIQRILTAEEFYAIYYSARKKVSYATKCLAIIKFFMILFIICCFVWNIFFAGRIPRESEYINKYQKVYITLEIGQTYDLYNTTYESELRSVRIDNFDSVMKLIEVKYPDTLESGIYNKRDLKEEITTINRGSFDMFGYFTEGSYYVTIPVLVGKEVDYTAVQPTIYRSIYA